MIELSLPVAIGVLVLAAAIVLVIGPRLVALADRLAEVTGIGEALFGAVALGATTSLPDIVATVQPALSGFGEQAAGNALGGVIAQTSFLAIADIAHRRANLEHAATSLPNLVQASVLITMLATIGVGLATPDVAIGPVHPVSIALPVVYWWGLRLAREVSDEPLWLAVETTDSEPDEDDGPPAVAGELRRRGGIFLVFAAILATAGWFVGEAGQVVVAETGLSEGAVGALLTAVSTSVAELVVSVAAVRRGALVLAVGNVIGGNTFDTLLMVVADVSYLDGTVYAASGPSMQVLVTIAIAMTTVLILGMLRRQRHGVGNIGTESAAVLALYLTAAWLIL